MASCRLNESCQGKQVAVPVGVGFGSAATEDAERTDAKETEAIKAVLIGQSLAVGWSV